MEIGDCLRVSKDYLLYEGSDFEMQVPIQIDVFGQLVFGILHIPLKPLPNLSIIIMCYGFNGNRTEEHRMMVTAGSRCEEIGIFMARFDYRGHGISEGEFWETKLAYRIQDVLSIISFLEGCFQKDKPKFFLVGFSDGARIASVVANQQSNIHGLILWNPIFTTKPSKPSKPLDTSNASKKLIREPNSGTLVYPLFGLFVKADYLRELNTTSSYNDFLQFEGKKVCIFGSLDDYTVKIREQMENDENVNVDIKIVEGAKHLFGSTKTSEMVIQETLNWVMNATL